VTGRTGRTRPWLLVGVVVAGAAAAGGMRFMVPPDEDTTIGGPVPPVTHTATAAGATAPGTTAASSPPASSAQEHPSPTSPAPSADTRAGGPVRDPFAYPSTTAGEAVAPEDGSVESAAAGAATEAGADLPAASDSPADTPTGATAPSGEGEPDDADAGPLDEASTEGWPTTTLPAATTTTRRPTVGMEMSSTGGYWLYQADGQVYAATPASWHGDLRSVPLRTPVVGMQATASGRGYYLVSSDGGVFAFGDAVYNGSLTETLALDRTDLLDLGYLAPTTTAATATTGPKSRA
jgi:hypothetical protein